MSPATVMVKSAAASPEAVGRAAGLLRDPRFEFVSGAFDEALWSMVDEGRRADAVLFDLGLSSFQVDEPERGFSYVSEGPLDMRMDPRSGTTAAAVLAEVGGRTDVRDLTIEEPDIEDVVRRLYLASPPPPPR